MIESENEAIEFAREEQDPAYVRPGATATVIGEGRNYSLASVLYRNLEASPGQVYLTPPLMTQNQELVASRSQAVRQARHIERTSEFTRSGINKSADLTVGSTLRATAIPDWQQLGFANRAEGVKWAREWGRLAESLFHSWAYDPRLLADSEGHYTFGGQMWMAFRNRKGPDGECAGVIHYDQERAERYGTPWATHVTIIDPQRIETPPEQMLNQTGVQRSDVQDGRLLDEWGRWIGMWVRVDEDRSPGAINQHVFVPREIEGGRPMAFHWFMKTRGAAQRGITDMVNMLRRNEMLDRFDNAILGQAAVAAALATYIKTQRPKKDVAEDVNIAPASPGAGGGLTDLTGLVTAKSEYYKKLDLRVGPNRIPMLDLDDELIIEAANSATADPTGFKQGYLREFASALGLDGEQFSNYYGDINYSSARLSLMNILRGVLRERGMFFPAVPSPIWGAVLEEAIIKGWLPLAPSANNDLAHFYRFREAYTRVRWTAPGLGWVDPQKEANAAVIRTDPANPISTLGDEAAAQGRSIDDLIQERSDEQDMLVEAGLIENKTDRALVKAAPAPEPAEVDDDSTGTGGGPDDRNKNGR